MTQWGSMSLGEQGYSPIEIIRHFYGDNMYVNTGNKSPAFRHPGQVTT